MPRYLTKSRFKLALECTSKLYYTGKREYVNIKLDDPFMNALAEGGFQVGELAKIYFEGGHNIHELEHELALAKTNKLLLLENVIIYEAAFLYNDLFVRADIVKKEGNTLELIEVKAKSYDPAGKGFLNATGNAIQPKWKPYLFDVAFQTYVVSKSRPEFIVKPYLMLADTSKSASIDGLNQCFFLQREDSRTIAIAKSGLTKTAVGNQILAQVDVNTIVQEIINGEHSLEPFEETINKFARHYRDDQLLQQPLGKRCANCEFKATDDPQKDGLRSGFHECWTNVAGFTRDDFNKPSVLDIWFYLEKEVSIQNKKYFQEQFEAADFAPKSPPSKKTSPIIGLSRSARQVLQIEKSKTKDTTYYLNHTDLKAQLDECIYPLHFIDFETTAVALPFNKNIRPYEQTAFQFSHHTIDANGTIKHSGQWINMEQGKFPNFDFVRALKAELENDHGSIFRYATHENSILNSIYEQLQKSSAHDKDELCQFIKTITHSKSSTAEKWRGDRDMNDMLEWVKKYYYSPATKGSNSIKHVLPAMLNDSSYLKTKYSEPIYGSDIRSLNFENHTWINFDASGKVISPYYTLPAIHEGHDNEELDSLMTDEEAGIFDGGAAMTAYAKMQFTEMSAEERSRIKAALLRYCELDTMAMVMLWEGWKNWCD